jgi:hypothetical protein
MSLFSKNNLQIETWDTPQERKKNLKARLSDARNSRLKKEEKWRMAEDALLPQVSLDGTAGLNVSPYTGGEGVDEQERPEIGTNYLLKNIRFLQSQMSNNVPICSPKPTSYDPKDREAADAADRVSRWALREYDIHDSLDFRNLQTLRYGTGITKKLWNPHLGEFLRGNEEEGFIMEGDFDLSIPSVWDIFIDADARKTKEIRFVFELIRVPWEQAAHRWGKGNPEKLKLLDKQRKKNGAIHASHTEETRSRHSPTTNYDVVELYEYWEKGLPTNGYQGRYCIITADGDEIEEMTINPESYKPIASTHAHMVEAVKEDKVPQRRAVLPYDFLTDLDDNESPWGESIVDYAAPLQDALNRLDSSILQTCDANGIPRLITSESAELNENALSADGYQVVKYTGNIPPDYMPAAPLPQIVVHLRAQIKNDINEMMGLNESMFGQQSREQSGYSQTYSVNQGNETRQRTFNKYVKDTENLYKRLLLMAANKWSTEKIISVIGDENSVEVSSFRGADIAYGYDVRCEFQSSLSLDPMTRRQELIQMAPILDKAGVSPKKQLDLVKMSELGNALDSGKLASNKMKKYFEKIKKTGVQQQPRSKENHAEMLDWANEYVMTTEFDRLGEPIKALIEEHMTIREDMLREQVNANQPPAPGEAPAGGEEAPALPTGPAVGLL